jgi:hypothetical protein
MNALHVLIETAHSLHVPARAIVMLVAERELRRLGA